MTTGYQIYNQSKTYFMTFQVIDWIDIFTRQLYSDIVIESLHYCRKEKGLEIWAYVIMSNHIHIILSSKNDNLSSVVRDFKRHTARKILKEIQSNKESRREWMLQRFKLEAKKRKRNSYYQFWTHENHAIEIINQKFLMQKMEYIHMNPVRARLVEKSDDWIYSSQRNYSKLSNVLEIDIAEL